MHYILRNINVLKYILISMDRSDKERERDAFRNSSEYTGGTYFVFSLLEENITHMLATTKLLLGLIPQLDCGNIRHSLNLEQLTAVKQHLMLETNSKIMSIIETLLVLFYAIDKGYDKIPPVMTYYEITMIDSSINKIKKKEFNLRKIIGLCDLGKIDLSEDEKKTLQICYKSTCNAIQKHFDEFVKFYESYKIIYGKSKHGFAFKSGIGSDSQHLKFEKSMLVAFDRRDIHNMPLDNPQVLRSRNSTPE